MPKKVLVLFAHPLFEKSRVQTALVKAIPRIAEVTFHDLYEFYPDFNINIRYEQEQLLQHDIIILQHPFYWYSVPPLIKQWIDTVLEYGWAYGKDGTALKGKWIMNAISAGSPFEDYHQEGRHRFTMRDFLAPIEQTFRLCHMEYLPPFVIHGTNHCTADTVREGAAAYHKLIEHLASGVAKTEDYNGRHYMNDLITAETNGR
jgi:glutathione-regulated potassium-efflux system ancillary protein KefG